MPVFVKDCCLLLEMSKLDRLVLVVLGCVCSAFGGSHRFHCPRQASLGAVLWECERNVRELTGCEAKASDFQARLSAGLEW